MEDGFQPLHRRVLRVDACVLVALVYWGEMSESPKAFRAALLTAMLGRGMPGP